MLSPLKLTSFENNFLEIGEDLELADTLSNFFSKPKSRDMWFLNTTRQDTTKELKNTQSISLRTNIAVELNKTTSEWNKEMEIATDRVLFNFPTFYMTYNRINKLLETVCKEFEIGRFFFSKLLPNTNIDLHTDEGSYFSYYDRFHFTISGNENNFFYIRDEKIELKLGHLYWVNNHVPHWLENKSDQDRINLIFDARLIS